MPDTLYPGSQFTDPLLFANTAQQITSAIPQGIQLGTQIRRQALAEQMAAEQMAASQRAEERLLADRRVASMGPADGGGATRTRQGQSMQAGMPSAEYMPSLDVVQQIIAQEQAERAASEEAIARRGQAFAPQYLTERTAQADLENDPYLAASAVAADQGVIDRARAFTPQMAGDGTTPAMGVLRRPGELDPVARERGEHPAGGSLSMPTRTVGMPAMGIMRRPGEFDPVARALAPEGMPLEDPLAGLLLSPQESQAQVEAGTLETDSSPEERQRFWQQLGGRQREMGQERQAVAEEEARVAAEEARKAEVSRNMRVVGSTTFGRKLDGEQQQAWAELDLDTMTKLLGKEHELVKARIGEQGELARVGESRAARKAEEAETKRRQEAVLRDEYAKAFNRIVESDPELMEALSNPAIAAMPWAQDRVEAARQEAMVEASRIAAQDLEPVTAKAGKAPAVYDEAMLREALTANPDIRAEGIDAALFRARTDDTFARKLHEMAIRGDTMGINEVIAEAMIAAGGGASPSPAPVPTPKPEKKEAKLQDFPDLASVDAAVASGALAKDTIVTVKGRRVKAG